MNNVFRITNEQNLIKFINNNNNNLIIVFIINKKNEIIKQLVKNHLINLFNDCLFIFIYNNDFIINSQNVFNINLNVESMFLSFNKNILDVIYDFANNIQKILYNVSYHKFKISNDINLILENNIKNMNFDEINKSIKLLENVQQQFDN
jgi:hypothetical protein